MATYDEDLLAELKDRRDDAQSQLDALAGENPEECDRLISEIKYLNGRIGG